MQKNKTINLNVSYLILLYLFDIKAIDNNFTHRNTLSAFH